METTVLLFLGLIFAHLIADYPLQGEFLATMKGKNFIILLSHAGIWTGSIAIAGIVMGLSVGLLDILLLFVIHSIADYLKAANKMWYKRVDPLYGGLISDQLIHVGQIIIFMGMSI